MAREQELIKHLRRHVADDGVSVVAEYRADGAPVLGSYEVVNGRTTEASEIPPDRPTLYVSDGSYGMAGFKGLRETDVGVVVGDGPETLAALDAEHLLDRGNLVFVNSVDEVVGLLDWLTEPSAEQTPAVSIASYRLPLKIDNNTGELTPSMGGVATGLANMTPPPHHWVGELSGHSDPLHGDGTDYHPLTVSERETEGHYAGFSNGILWPTYHGLREFVPGADDVRFWENAAGEWFEQYQRVNQRFADELARQAEPDSIAWVHDYQLQLVSGMLRDQRPDLTLGYFAHTPFPNYTDYSTIPHHEELLAGLLANDVLGFQTPRDVKNFVDTVRKVVQRSAEAGSPFTVNGELVRVVGDQIQVENRQVAVRNYPISIDYDKYDSLGRSDEIARKTEEIKETVGHRKIIAGIERLDYTKGISERIDALELLLAEGRFDPRQEVMYLSFAKAREGVEAAQQYAELLSNRIAELNAKYRIIDPKTGRSWEPIHDHWDSVSPEEVPAVYRAADVMTITPLKDGMNLMAKEFIASRSDERGTLLLGGGAGAAVELGPSGAVIVDPRNTRELADGMERALHMSEPEQRERMRGLRRQVRTHQVGTWNSRIIQDLNQARTEKAPARVGGIRQRRRTPSRPIPGAPATNMAGRGPAPGLSARRRQSVRRQHRP
ncbi:MAG TPA: trehalose-6-phosphate synthase [Mycobacteriales bacterium]|nr:trehalose-6-phosphate synthase [Mycobacteriales bacterium]